MPRPYEPKLYDKNFHDSYQDYLSSIKANLVNEHEVCNAFCVEHVEIKEEKTPRVHTIELYREFVLWSEDYPKLHHRISDKLFQRFACGYFGRSRQTYYTPGYYPNILVPEPISQSLIKLYNEGKEYEWEEGKDYCPVCHTPLDFTNKGEELECLVCKIGDSKDYWGSYHNNKTREARNRKKAIQAPKG